MIALIIFILCGIITVLFAIVFLKKQFKSRFVHAPTIHVPRIVITDPREIPKELRKLLEKKSFSTSTLFYKGKVQKSLYAQQFLISEDNTHFLKEVYCRGDVMIGSKNVLDRFIVDGDLTIGQETKVLKDIDTEKELFVQMDCNLGERASAGNGMTLGGGCHFKSLYALPIFTSELINKIQLQPYFTDDIASVTQEGICISNKFTSIPPNTTIDQNLIVNGDLYLGSNVVITQSVKTYGNLFIGENVQIKGDVFSEKNIEVGAGATIDGCVFSQREISFSENIQIGKKGSVKSVIGRKKVSLGPRIKIYGFVKTYGQGVIAKEPKKELF